MCMDMSSKKSWRDFAIVVGQVFNLSEKDLHFRGSLRWGATGSAGSASAERPPRVDFSSLADAFG